MELSERAIQEFEREGYNNIYEHQDPPGKVYDERSNPADQAIFVTDGSITYIIDGVEKEIMAPRRFNIPANTPHSAIVGSDGMIAIIAE
tara:strand:+ start:11088 stop:11354 length:267 start_codon:yes stop_codon:yes gene_type:complete